MNTNHLYGSFLSYFKLDLGDIVNCCQYVGHYLNYKMLRLTPLESVTLEEYLSAYHYNPEIFRFFQLKYETEFINN